MSGAAHASAKGVSARLVQAFGLMVTFAVLYAVTRIAPDVPSRVAMVAGVGFLLLSGTLMSELLETIGLPHLTGYLVAGVLAGPHVLHLVDHAAVQQLSAVNTLALALIALAGGAELRVVTLRKVARSLAWATLLQSTVVLVALALVFMAVARFVPFARDLAWQPLLGVALLWGVMAITRSPSACMAILSQTRAKGPLASFSLAFIMLSDMVVVVLLATVLTMARPLVLGGAMSLDDVQRLGHEIIGSIAVGTTFGLLLAIYLRLVGRQLLLVLLGIGFVLTDALRYVHADPLLAFMTAGFVVQNFTAQGKKLIEGVEQTGSVVFVIFFATAGAHLDLPLLRALWPIALGLCASRALVTWVTSRLSSRIAGDDPVIARYGAASLFSQAGLALGVGTLIARAFPQIGAGFQALVIATVALNEMFGPIIFKLALDRAQETDSAAVESRPTASEVADEETTAATSGP